MKGELISFKSFLSIIIKQDEGGFDVILYFSCFLSSLAQFFGEKLQQPDRIPVVLLRQKRQILKTHKQPDNLDLEPQL